MSFAGMKNHHNLVIILTGSFPLASRLSAVFKKKREVKYLKERLCLLKRKKFCYREVGAFSTCGYLFQKRALVANKKELLKNTFSIKSAPRFRQNPSKLLTKTDFELVNERPTSNI